MGERAASPEILASAVEKSACAGLSATPSGRRRRTAAATTGESRREELDTAVYRVAGDAYMRPVSSGPRVDLRTFIIGPGASPNAFGGCAGGSRECDGEDCDRDAGLSENVCVLSQLLGPRASSPGGGMLAASSSLTSAAPLTSSRLSPIVSLHVIRLRLLFGRMARLHCHPRTNSGVSATDSSGATSGRASP